MSTMLRVQVWVWIGNKSRKRGTKIPPNLQTFRVNIPLPQPTKFTSLRLSSSCVWERTSTRALTALNFPLLLVTDDFDQKFKRVVPDDYSSSCDCGSDQPDYQLFAFTHTQGVVVVVIVECILPLFVSLMLLQSSNCR